ncbi:TatD family nuclease-associated radical SAM protein [Selenihalanaerobacter shriftii]|uniref:Radical SAM protein, TatD family-associated n=1 Tax=Selenihalanaerobacter shriftii TaxID=142842 RepID=A0A1T4N8Z1_9FIRM|nr:TatD family nuclease-associated radical SAM protein [Selenihalanaerobacter shriftii]SJZ75563.1 radical SAM protein, TatD family-associated [Selenihalanaerobacter shriftii]
MANTYTYELGNSLYLNLTNQCTNKCKFCIRDYKDGVGENNLWLDKEPTADEIINDIDKNPEVYDEIVFCGYGEPLIRLETILEVAKWLKQFDVQIRIDTNGQVNLIHNRNIAPELEGLIDVISISLNAKNANKYQQLCESDFGTEAFKSILDFAESCKNYIPKVILTVVNYSTTSIYECRKIAENLDVDFRVRQLCKEEE